MNLKRVRPISPEPYQKGSVLCALGRDIRARDNDALIYAAHIAHTKQVPLIITINIWPQFLGATSRYYDFFYEGLQETESFLRALGIPLVLLFGREEDTVKQFIDKENVGFLVTDFLPLHFSKVWKNKLLETIDIPWYEVDAHNIVPAWITSDKQEFAARTIRPKLYKLLPDFLDEYDTIEPFKREELLEKFPPIDYALTRAQTQEKTILKSAFIGGESRARMMLDDFLKEKLLNYDEDRNDFCKDGQSNLSPYISKGMISKRRIALTALSQEKKQITEVLDKEKNGSSGERGSLAAFLEELIVRSELAENFCFYNEKYRSIQGAADWAQKALDKARSDTREYIYTLEIFEKGLTHDKLWNAAQEELLQTGKMHGYLRMYWAKKVLEWTKSPEEALSYLIYLNDTYHIDGLDPNGYAGILWSVAGLHDRAWFPRPIFGTIRYMAESGAQKRGDVKNYIQTWTKIK